MTRARTKDRLFRLMMLSLPLLPMVVSAQTELFSEDFASQTEGRPAEDRWQIIGSKDSQYWNIKDKELQTGNLDEYYPGLTFAFIRAPGSSDWTETTISAEFVMRQDEGAVALAARVRDSNNYYYAVFRVRPGANGAGVERTVEIAKLSNGVPRSLANTVNGKVDLPPFESDKSKHRISLSVKGDKISTSFDGKEVLTASDSSLPSGSAGVGAAFNEVGFSNVVVTGPAPAAGSSATKAAPAAGASWRLIVVANLSQAEAESHAKFYSSQGFQDVEVLPKDDKFAVYLGRYPTEEEARTAHEKYKNDDGLLLEGVELISATAVASAPSGGGAGSAAAGRGYRVQVGTFSSSSEASAFRDKVEAEEGIFPVDVVTEGSTYLVLAGFAFPDRREVDETVNQLRSKGLDAKVIETAMEVPDAPAGGTSYGSNLSKESQDRLKKIDELIKQGHTLDDQNKIIEAVKALSPEEQAALAEGRKREAKIKELQERYDKAVYKEKNLEEGLKILDEWAEIDPENPMLASMKRDLRQRAGQSQGSVVDNDAGPPNFTTEGAWSPGSMAGINNSTSLVAAAGNANKAVWNANLAQAGTYEVAVNYRADANRASSVQYEITSADAKMQAASINQKEKDQQWVSLGKFTLPAGPVSVALNAKASNGGQFVSADAVRLSFQGSGSIVAATSPAERLASLMANAKQKEANGRFEDAKQDLLEAKNLNPPSNLVGEINESLIRLEDAISKSEGNAPKSSGGGKMGLILGILGGVAVLGAAGAAVAMMRKGKKAAPASPAPLSSTVATPSPKTPPPAAPAAPASRSTPNTPVPTSLLDQARHPAGNPAISAPTPLASKQVVTDSDRIRPGTLAPAPGARESSSGAVPVGKQEDKAARQAAAARQAEAAASAGDINIDDVVDLNDDQGLVVPDSTPVADPVPASGTPASGEFMVGPLPDSAPVLHSSPPSGIQMVDPGTFYAQNFEDEEVGRAPRNWKGTYDYASLVVTDQNLLDGSKRCLRFEKRQGTGSAYYACRFPDATGRVVVEYDLRCDDKNKYLLGFYIEKDEDFRHSIHTVVHKDTAKGNKVLLRLQNESFPYTLGQWVHIRFLIDLPRNLVDGYVDDKPVAVGVRLISRPKVINTLSIRDNLATEGLLLIDNIRIYKDR